MAFASGTVLPRCVSVRGWVDFLTVDFGLFWSMNSRHGWKGGGAPQSTVWFPRSGWALSSIGWAFQRHSPEVRSSRTMKCARGIVDCIGCLLDGRPSVNLGARRCFV